MPTYAIGDVQGCLAPLEALLEKLHYHPQRDTLWFVGDIVNRGPQSLATLRYIKNLPPSTICVMGNHDLALLGIAKGMIPNKENETFNEVLTAPDLDELMEWLRQRPLLYHDPHLKYTLTHAGVYPHWDLNQAIMLAKEVEQVLRGPNYLAFLKNMFGNDPENWDDSLTGWDRLRFITNAFTRMRFCTKTNALDLTAKGSIAQNSNDLPWFAVENRKTKGDTLIFGHWAALNGRCDLPNLYPIDTGCVYGNCLTAFCLETTTITTIKCTKEY